MGERENIYGRKGEYIWEKGRIYMGERVGGSPDQHPLRQYTIFVLRRNRGNFAQRMRWLITVLHGVPFCRPYKLVVRGQILVQLFPYKCMRIGMVGLVQCMSIEINAEPRDATFKGWVNQ